MIARNYEDAAQALPLDRPDYDEIPLSIGDTVRVMAVYAEDYGTLVDWTDTSRPIVLLPALGLRCAVDAWRVEAVRS